MAIPESDKLIIFNDIINRMKSDGLYVTSAQDRVRYYRDFPGLGSPLFVNVSASPTQTSGSYSALEVIIDDIIGGITDYYSTSAIGVSAFGFTTENGLSAFGNRIGIFYNPTNIQINSAGQLDLVSNPTFQTINLTGLTNGQLIILSGGRLVTSAIHLGSGNSNNHSLLDNLNSDDHLQYLSLQPTSDTRNLLSLNSDTIPLTIVANTLQTKNLFQVVDSNLNPIFLLSASGDMGIYGSILISESNSSLIFQDDGVHQVRSSGYLNIYSVSGLSLQSNSVSALHDLVIDPGSVRIVYLSGSDNRIVMADPTGKLNRFDLITWDGSNNIFFPSLSGVGNRYLVVDSTGKLISTSAVGSVSATASGTVGTIAKFITSASLGDSLISENGTLVTINGDLKISSYTGILSGANGQIVVAPLLPISVGGTNNNSFSNSFFLWFDGNSLVSSPFSSASFSPALSGTVNYIPKFNSSNSLTNSLISDNGSITLSANTTVGGSSIGNTTFSIDGLSGTLSQIIFKKMGVNRWIIRSGAQTEISGTNQGSLFQIIARDDAGNQIDIPFQIDRPSGGPLYLARPIIDSSDLNVSGNAQIVGKIIGYDDLILSSPSKNLVFTDSSSHSISSTGTLDIKSGSIQSLSTTSGSIVLKPNLSPVMTISNSVISALNYELTTINFRIGYLSGTNNRLTYVDQFGNLKDTGVLLTSIVTTSGNGTINRITKFITSGSIGNSLIWESGTSVLNDADVYSTSGGFWIGSLGSLNYGIVKSGSSLVFKSGDTSVNRLMILSGGDSIFSGSIATSGNLVVSGTSTFNSFVGSVPLSNIGYNLQGDLNYTSITQYGFASQSTFNSNAVQFGVAFYSRPTVKNQTFTMGSLIGFFADDANMLGVSTTVTNQYGVYVGSQTKGLTNYSIFTNQGLISFGDTLTFRNTSIGGDSSIWKSSNDGFSLRGVAGSTYDFSIFTPSATYLIRNPHGTQNLEFPGIGSNTFTGNIYANLNIISQGDVYAGSNKGFWFGGTSGLYTYGMNQNGTNLEFRSGAIGPFLTVNNSSIATFLYSTIFGSTVDIALKLKFTDFGSAADGSIWRDNQSGLSMRGVSASSYDFSIFTPSATYLIRNPHGTQNLEMLGSINVSGATSFANTTKLSLYAGSTTRVLGIDSSGFIVPLFSTSSSVSAQSGTTNTIAKFTGPNSIGNSLITETASFINIASSLSVDTTMGVGIDPDPSFALYINSTLLQGSDQYGIYNTPTFTSAANSFVVGNYIRLQTFNSSVTIPDAYNIFIEQPTVGQSPGNFTRYYGLKIADLTRGTASNIAIQTGLGKVILGDVLNVSGSVTTNAGFYTNGFTASTTRVGVELFYGGDSGSVFGSGCLRVIDRSTGVYKPLIIGPNMNIDGSGNTIVGARLNVSGASSFNSTATYVGPANTAAFHAGAGFFQVNGVGINQIVLNSVGSFYGFISNPSSNTWALGYGNPPTTLGTSVLTWNSSALVTIAGNLTVTGTASFQSGLVRTSPNTINLTATDRGYLIIGPSGGLEVQMDYNSIAAMNNATPSQLYLTYNHTTIINGAGTSNRGLVVGDDFTSTIGMVDVRQRTTNNVMAAFGESASVGANRAGYIYFSATNTINFAYQVDADGAEGWINYWGYNNGPSRYRNLSIGDGRQNRWIWFDGQNKRIIVNNGNSADSVGSLQVTGKTKSDYFYNNSLYTGAVYNAEASGTVYFQANDGSTVNILLGPGGSSNPYNYFRRGISIGTEQSLLSMLDVRSSDAGVIAGFGAITSVGADYPNFIYFSNVNTINFGFNRAAITGGWINYNGYQNSTSYYRDLYIADGKQNQIAKFEGSSGNIFLASNNGKVRIGDTTTPSYALDVRGTDIRLGTGLASDVIFRLETNGGSNTAYFSAENATNRFNLGGSGWLCLNPGNAVAAVIHYVGTNDGRMRIGGNMGDAVAPSSTLYVDGHFAASYVSFTTGATLNKNTFINIEGPGTFNLPAATACPGRAYFLTRQTSFVGSAAVAAAGTDTIIFNGSSFGTLSGIVTGTSLILVSDGSSKWYVFNWHA